MSNILKLSLNNSKNCSYLRREATGNPIEQREARILKKLELKFNPHQGSMQIIKKTSTEKSFWKPPSHGFLKFNIDGASKGNPGEAGYGGVLRDDEGNIQVIIHSYLGKAANNMIEFMAMETCLEILLRYNIQNVTIEVDSELVINSAKRINVGATPEKISEHWKLLQIYQRIQVHLRMFRTLALVHVHREANKMTDWLANEGVQNKNIDLCCWWEEITDGKLKEGCSSRALSHRQ